MAYKDKDKQREADRERQRLRRDRIKAKGVTDSGCDTKGVTEVFKDKGRTRLVSDQEFTRLMAQTGAGHVRVSKPGDSDYIPQCETTRAFVDGRAKRPETGKRGKDIKVFADLPPDVQVSIDRMSINKDGTVNQTVKANRTAIAVSYQHLYPDRYYSTGVA